MHKAAQGQQAHRGSKTQGQRCTTTGSIREDWEYGWGARVGEPGQVRV